MQEPLDGLAQLQPDLNIHPLPLRLELEQLVRCRTEKKIALTRQVNYFNQQSNSKEHMLHRIGWVGAVESSTGTTPIASRQVSNFDHRNLSSPLWLVSKNQPHVRHSAD
jgi:hypothetical protein